MKTLAAAVDPRQSKHGALHHRDRRHFCALPRAMYSWTLARVDLSVPTGRAGFVLVEPPGRRTEDTEPDRTGASMATGPSGSKPSLSILTYRGIAFRFLIAAFSFVVGTCRLNVAACPNCRRYI